MVTQLGGHRHTEETLQVEKLSKSGRTPSYDHRYLLKEIRDEVLQIYTTSYILVYGISRVINWGFTAYRP